MCFFLEELSRWSYIVKKARQNDIALIIDTDLNTIEQELLGNEGFPHQFGITIKRSPDEILIEEDLQKPLPFFFSNLQQ